GPRSAGRSGEQLGRSRPRGAGRRAPRLVGGGLKSGEGRPPGPPAPWRTWGKQAKRARGQRPLSRGSSSPPFGGLSLWSVATGDLPSVARLRRSLKEK